MGVLKLAWLVIFAVMEVVKKNINISILYSIRFVNKHRNTVYMYLTLKIYLLILQSISTFFLISSLLNFYLYLILTISRLLPQRFVGMGLLYTEIIIVIPL